MNIFKDLINQKMQTLQPKRHKHYHIYLDDEFYMSFQDKYSRYQHFNSNKFKKISEGRDVYFFYSSNKYPPEMSSAHLKE